MRPVGAHDLLLQAVSLHRRGTVNVVFVFLAVGFHSQHFSQPLCSEPQSRGGEVRLGKVAGWRSIAADPPLTPPGPPLLPAWLGAEARVWVWVRICVFPKNGVGEMCAARQHVLFYAAGHPAAVCTWLTTQSRPLQASKNRTAGGGMFAFLGPAAPSGAGSGGGSAAAAPRRRNSAPRNPFL
jgi:hypothetical protein